MEHFNPLRWAGAPMELTNPFSTGAKAGEGASRPGSLRVPRGVGGGLALGRVPCAGPMSATIDG